MAEPRRAWERELGCFGYFGFGGGYAAVTEHKDQPGFGLYCNVCPISKECWIEHRARAKEIFPDLMAELERLLAENPGKGNLAAGQFWQRFQVAPPDIAINGGNIEDGMSIAGGGQPRDRGRATLTWPLEPR